MSNWSIICDKSVKSDANKSYIRPMYYTLVLVVTLPVTTIMTYYHDYGIQPVHFENLVIRHADKVTSEITGQVIFISAGLMVYFQAGMYSCRLLPLKEFNLNSMVIF